MVIIVFVFGDICYYFWHFPRHTPITYVQKQSRTHTHTTFEFRIIDSILSCIAFGLVQTCSMIKLTLTFDWHMNHSLYTTKFKFRCLHMCKHRYSEENEHSNDGSDRTVYHNWKKYQSVFIKNKQMSTVTQNQTNLYDTLCIVEIVYKCCISLSLQTLHKYRL